MAEVMSADEAFFVDHPDRKARIRLPKDETELRREFRSLGPHQYARRRILVARVEPVIALRYGQKLMEIPFLAFADETIEDRDDVLLPILDEIMRNARREQMSH